MIGHLKVFHNQALLPHSLVCFILIRQAEDEVQLVLEELILILQEILRSPQQLVSSIVLEGLKMIESREYLLQLEECEGVVGGFVHVVK